MTEAEGETSPLLPDTPAVASSSSTEGRREDPAPEPSGERVDAEDEELPAKYADLESKEVALGVHKVVLQEGRGEDSPKLHATCFVRYRAWVKKSKHKFHDTWSEGSTVQLVLGHEKPTVRGLATGVGSMRAGERALFHVAADLAYGKEGSFSFPHVPPSSDVVYEAELVGFDNPREGRAPGEMTVEERIAAADRRRVDGNLAFKGDDVEEAMHQYEIALGYMDDDFMFQMFGKYRDMANAVRLPCVLNMAACHLKKGAFHEAIAQCSVVLAEEPNNVKALFRRGRARAQLGQSDGAREDLEKAQRLAPGDKAVLKELQALAGQDRSLEASRRKLYKGMFRAAANPAPGGAGGGGGKRPWYLRLWDAVWGFLRRLWPVKGGGKKKAE